MKKLLSLICLLACISAHTQTHSTQSCKVEIYLLKSPKIDTTKKHGLSGEFHVQLSDLQDTAFIKDSEIKSYTINGNKQKGTVHIIKVTPLAVERIKQSGLSLASGKQFVIVANGKIAYTGYFWNYYSSFGCDWVTAYANGDSIGILRKLPDYNFKPGYYDPRENQMLFDCLKSTNRFTREPN